MNKFNIQVNKNPKKYYNNTIDHHIYSNIIWYSRIFYVNSFVINAGIYLRKELK